MNGPKTLTILAVLVIVASLVWWQGSRNTEDKAQSAQLFDTLGKQVNSVDSVSIQNAGSEPVRIVRNDGAWQLPQKENYAADTGKLRKLLLTLGEAKVLERKTTNPEFYSRLGVQGIGQSESGATLLELTGAEFQYRLLVGNTAQRSGGASYVRKPDQAQALLVAPGIEVPLRLADWLDTRLADIGPKELYAIDLRPATGASISLYKSSRTQREFAHKDAGDETLDRASVDGLSRALANLVFEDVQSAGDFDAAPYLSSDLTFTTFDGIVVDVRIMQSEEDSEARYFSASARFDAALAQSLLMQSTGSDEDASEIPESERITLTSTDIADREKQVESMNSVWRGWVFKLGTQNFGRMTHTRETLLAE